MDIAKSYDYIVIGAGAAGCAAAARLSEEATQSVLLIEAGRDDPWIWLKIPLGIGKVLVGNRALWRYETEAEPELKGRKIFWPRGRVLGGTSTVNGMLWVRGDPQEYDHWAENGCDGWGYQDLLPSFKAIETTQLGADAYRGRGGPVNVVEYGPQDALNLAFLQACAQAGIPSTSDYNGATYEGAAMLQLNTRKGLRHGAREAYAHPALSRPNLTVLSGAKAQKILLDGRRATGVRILGPRGEVEYHADKEIILCAGAIDSPKLLQLSGIGDPDHLRSVGVTPLHGLRGVGRNLRDHIHTRLSFRCSEPITLNDVMRNPLRQVLFGARYLLRRDGLMASSTSTAHALMRSDPTKTRPDVKLQLHPLTSSDARNPRKLVFDKFPGFGIGTFPLRPQSTGTVMITSPNAEAAPAIAANYLSAPEDLDIAVAAVKMALRVAHQPALGGLMAQQLRPAPSAKSVKDLEDFVRETGTTSYHPIGTCKMGQDDLAVVDANLKVRGIEGLRVADASIFPTMPSSNTHAPSILVGEEVARRIRSE
ncbi:GMC family oxidoreductase N-terminal domain-containing protein [Cognatishimia sp. SS12]|uniref:GMC family oxidoreductase n=1 Tax=Cognatishimia sp. SS12 TaxID=2979465 RepID=UPI0023302A4E|nr:GMC family oxidoreductase N-terminal domain-containing protein [Cognatishimia sp. SS12]MDC0738301.1 GMC family oxidoreductase N-terminal domain-containing protein [Cognatishimia sp. SS12]